MTHHGDTILYHAPCFDGLISAVVAKNFLENALGWNIENLVPVTYGRGDKHERLDGRTAIVDFRYHPGSDAKFWIDHHQTTFLNTADQAHYENALANDATRFLVYDKTAKAGAELLWRYAEQHSSDRERFGEMVKWATLIDSAGYESAEQAVFGDAAAMQICMTLGAKIDAKRLNALIYALQTESLEEVASMPLVVEPFAITRERHERGQEIISRSIRVTDIGVGVYEATPGNDSPSRYGAFLARPDIRYSVSLIHDDRGSKISASRNPWHNADTAARLGTILKGYGGGGHDAVGSLQLAPGSIAESREILGKIVRDIEDAETQQNALPYSPTNINQMRDDDTIQKEKHLPYQISSSL